MNYSYHVANYIIDLAKKENIRFNTSKMNSLVYLVSCWNLVINNDEIIYDTPMISNYGPRYDWLFRILNRYGTGEIEWKITKNDVYYNSKSTYTNDVIKGDFNKEQKKVIKKVYDIHKKYSDNDLVDIITQKGTPWYKCYKMKSPPNTIPLTMIKKYYTKLVIKNRKIKSKQICFDSIT